MGHYMRIRIPILTAVAAAALMGSAAHADVIVTSVRATNANLPAYDTVFIYAKNDGTGAEAAGAQGIVSVFVDITDNTQAGLLAGLYRTGGTTTSTAANTLARANGDPTGAQMGNNKTFNSNTGTIPVYGTSTYPVDAGIAELYSWIGNGNINTNYNSPGNESANGAFAPQGSTSTTVANNPYGVLLTSFHSEGGYAGGIDGSVLGGIGDGNGALIAVAVVKHLDAVSFSGQVGTDVGNIVSFAGTDGVPAPEPASLGVLALGGLALLARRRKTA